MPTTNLLQLFPARRIKPFDGMAVTAETWETDHHELRSSRKAHDLAFHGSGIITGLDVLANDPPDRVVFISPGAAIDPDGNVIVLPERVAYDFGSSIEGPLTLYITHGEREVAGVEADSVMIQSEYVISARSEAPKKPSVELARVTLRNTNDPIRMAADTAHPAHGELDLRLRNQVGVAQPRKVRIALCELTAPEKELHASWDHMLRAANTRGITQYLLDTGVLITDQMGQYDLIALAGRGNFRLTPEMQAHLRGYLDAGGKLLVEGLDAEGNEAFGAILDGMGIVFGQDQLANNLQTAPHFFPSACEGHLGAELALGQGVIFSKAGHSLAWGGYAQSQHPTREAIRAAHEWAENMITHLVGLP